VGFVNDLLIRASPGTDQLQHYIFVSCRTLGHDTGSRKTGTTALQELVSDLGRTLFILFPGMSRNKEGLLGNEIVQILPLMNELHELLNARSDLIGKIGS
jgi:hypothetical protein